MYKQHQNTAENSDDDNLNDANAQYNEENSLLWSYECLEDENRNKASFQSIYGIPEDIFQDEEQNQINEINFQNQEENCNDEGAIEIRLQEIESENFKKEIQNYKKSQNQNVNCDDNRFEKKLIFENSYTLNNSYSTTRKNTTNDFQILNQQKKSEKNGENEEEINVKNNCNIYSELDEDKSESKQKDIEEINNFVTTLEKSNNLGILQSKGNTDKNIESKKIKKLKKEKKNSKNNNDNSYNNDLKNISMKNEKAKMELEQSKNNNVLNKQLKFIQNSYNFVRNDSRGKRICIFENKNHINKHYVQSNKNENKKDELIKKKRDIVIEKIKNDIKEEIKLGDIEKYIYREFKEYLKWNKNKFHLNNDFWHSYFAKKSQNELVHDFIILLFSKKDTLDLYEKFLKDEKFHQKNKEKIIAQDIDVHKFYKKNFHKIYCEKYKETDLDLV